MSENCPSRLLVEVPGDDPGPEDYARIGQALADYEDVTIESLERDGDLWVEVSFDCEMSEFWHRLFEVDDEPPS